MAILKCKMCGGDLHIEEGMTVCECEYCGSKQTVPTIDNDKKIALYERANKLRYNCEFDKAETAYESIVADFHDEAEAYWGLVLCKYGIEYVDDPATGKKVPTCHRSSFDSVMDDTDFEMVMENSDDDSRQVYREQAKQIEEIRKGIIEVSGKEQPYDIFICYKETAKDGQRTIDSILAQDVYDALTSKGYRVFFSRITLEDKLGQEYEPYIFAALNSAKIMLAFGTTYDYYNAVWVKNEWSRFLKLMAADKNKHLIPCYKNIDAYDIPKEFAKLQAQDMGKVGAIQDLIRGIDKIIGKSVGQHHETKVEKESLQVLLDRGTIALEDSEWSQAGDFYEKVLNIDPRNAEAYLGEFLVNKKCNNINKFEERIKNNLSNVENQKKYVEVEIEGHIREISKKYVVEGYLDHSTIRQLYIFDNSYDSCLENRISNSERILKEIEENNLYIRAKQYALSNLADRLDCMISNLHEYANKLILVEEKADQEKINRINSDYQAFTEKNDLKIAKLHENAIAERENEYAEFVKEINKCKEKNTLKRISQKYNKLRGYRETDKLIRNKERSIKKSKIIVCVSIAAVALLLVGGYFLHWEYVNVIVPRMKYSEAIEYKNRAEYEKAMDIFNEILDYKDSSEQINDIEYKLLYEYVENGNLDDALVLCEKFEKDEDKIDEVKEQKYEIALKYGEQGYSTKAISILRNLGPSYKDALTEYKKIDADCNAKYEYAVKCIDEKKYDEARTILEKICDYKYSQAKINYIDWITADFDISDANIGDTIYIGKCEQDNDVIDGSEPVEWIVVDKQEDKIFVLSKYTLYAKKGNASLSMDKVEFKEEEKKCIIVGEENDFELLKVSDVDKYFIGDLATYKASPITSSAIRGEVGRVKTNREYAVWAVENDNDGKTVSYGVDSVVENFTYNGYVGVRPAMWIKTQ